MSWSATCVLVRYGKAERARVAAFIQAGAAGGDLYEVGLPLHQHFKVAKIKMIPSFWSSAVTTRNLTLEYFDSKSILIITTRPQRPKKALTSLFVHDANTFLI